MITECWTPQSSHRDTFFSIYLVIHDSHVIEEDMSSNDDAGLHQIFIIIIIYCFTDSYFTDNEDWDLY